MPERLIAAAVPGSSIRPGHSFEGLAHDGEEPSCPSVGDALDRAERAHAELRELVHGILPAMVTRGGLAAGVRALVRGLDVPVGVDVPDDGMLHVEVQDHGVGGARPDESGLLGLDDRVAALGGTL